MRSSRRVRSVAVLVALIVVGPLAFGQTVTAVVETPSGPDVLIKTGDSTTSALKVLNSDNVNLLRVTAGGNVGIGTTTPGQKLEVFNGTVLGGAVVISTPLAGSFAVNTPIGGLRLSWKHASSPPNNVDFQVIRGWDATDGAGLAIFTSPSNASTVERMRITSAGKVGIGTASPSAKLTVLGTASGTAGLLAQQDSTITTGVTLSEVSTLGAMYTRVSEGVTQAGYAHALRGVSYVFDKGTLTNAYGLSTEVGNFPGVANTGTIQNAYGLYPAVRKNDGTIVNGYGLYIPDVTATSDWGIVQAGTDDENLFQGKTTIGAANPQQPYPVLLDVRGNVTVLGSITGATVIGATYQDIAEWVPASSNMEPGTVVVLNHERTNEVMPSSRAYDTSVAGVVSAQPGVILGVAGDSKEQIATTGRVRVRVDASIAPVRVGDLLVTSDKPGMAMRSESLEFAGRRLHQPGTIIGKALEPLDRGEGEILVLLSLQ